MAGIENVPGLFSLSKHISPLDSTVVFDIPFTGGNLISTEVVNLDLSQRTYSYYSSYNNFLIFPNYPITNSISLSKFVNRITSTLHSDSTIDYDLLTTHPTGCPTLNINFKYGILFDNSLVGLASSNTFDYSPTKPTRQKCTNIN